MGYLLGAGDSKLERFENGLINWTDGFCLGIATEKALGRDGKERFKRVFTSFGLRDEIQRELIHKAKINLLDIILSIRIDSFNYVHNYFDQSVSFRELFLTQVEKNIEVLPTVFKGPDRVSVAVKYSLYGKGGLEDLIYRLDDNIEELAYKHDDELVYERVMYTSLIIDLRGIYSFVDSVYEQSIFLPDLINLPLSLRARLEYDAVRKRLICKGVLTLEEKEELLSLFPDNNYYRSVVEGLYSRSRLNERQAKVKPSLFPTIYDSEGRKIYFKNLLKVEERSLVQFVNYTKDSLILYKVEMVGSNPLYTVADKVRGENDSDIIIGAEDSRKLFLDPGTLENLKKGKIFILID